MYYEVRNTPFDMSLSKSAATRCVGRRRLFDKAPPPHSHGRITSVCWVYKLHTYCIFHTLFSPYIDINSLKLTVSFFLSNACDWAEIYYCYHNLQHSNKLLYNGANRHTFGQQVNIQSLMCIISNCTHGQNRWPWRLAC